jgi:hypothetical protein
MDDKLDRILETMLRVSVELESLRVSVTSLLSVSHDHEQRLRLLERWRNNLTPLVAVLTFVLGAVFQAALRNWA